VAAVKDAGGKPVQVAPTDEPVQAVNGDTETADTFTPDRTVDDVSVHEFDALVLPWRGG
jgi:protease I